MAKEIVMREIIQYENKDTLGSKMCMGCPLVSPFCPFEDTTTVTSGGGSWNTAI
jgi:hypothetical protein